MGYIFIRYVKKDRAFAEQLSNELEQAGIDVWRGAEEIAPGQDWGEAIRAAIAQADAVLFLSSQHSARSRLIANELDIALERNIPVLPVVLDFLGFKNMPRKLYGIDWIDFRKDYQATFEHLVERIPAPARQRQPVERKAIQSKGYVFISYAEENTAFVVQLREFLKQRGYSYWDYQDSQRNYHTQLFIELEDVIRDAAATLSVMSQAWRESPWTPKEYLFSEQVATPVFLLRIEDVEPTLLTVGVPYINFVDDVAEGFQKLEAELVRKGLL